MSDLIKQKSVEDAVDLVFDLLLEDAAYLAPSKEPEVRYAPDASLLELIAWNVVVSFWVNVAASYFYDYFVRRVRKKEMEEKEQLKKEVDRLRGKLSSAREKLATKAACVKILAETNEFLKSVKATPTVIQLLNLSPDPIATILKDWGWPNSEAKSMSEAIKKKLQTLRRRHT